jgi:hypothetical protein
MSNQTPRDHFTITGPLYGQPTTIFIDVAGAHEDECSFWHGGDCDCTPEMQAARTREHHQDCDWRWAGWRCNCHELEAGLWARLYRRLKSLRRG